MDADRSIYGTMAMVLGIVCAGAMWWCCGAMYAPDVSVEAPATKAPVTETPEIKTP